MRFTKFQFANIFSTLLLISYGFVNCDKSIRKRSFSATTNLINLSMNYTRLLGRIEDIEAKLSENFIKPEENLRIKDTLDDLKESIADLQKKSNVENYKLIVSREVEVLRRQIWGDLQGIKTQFGYLNKKNEILQKGQERLAKILKSSLEKNIINPDENHVQIQVSKNVSSPNSTKKNEMLVVDKKDFKNSTISQSNSNSNSRSNSSILDSRYIFQETFLNESSWTSKWNNIKGYTKYFSWKNESIWTGDRGDYGIIANFPKIFSSHGKPLVLQYSIKYPEKPNPLCTYTYLSLYDCEDQNMKNDTKTKWDTPELVRLYIFNCPRKQFGLRLRNPLNKNLIFDSDFIDLPNYYQQPNTNDLYDDSTLKFPQFFTLILYPNDSIEFLLNGKKVYSRSFIWPLEKQGFDNLCRIGLKFGQPVEGVGVRFDDFLVTSDIDYALIKRSTFTHV